MANTPVSLVDTFRSLAAEDLAQAGEHLLPEEIFAYTSGEASEARSRSWLFHLALCPDCASRVLDGAQFPNIPLREPRLLRTETEEADDWLAIRAQTIPPGSALPRLTTSPAVWAPTSRPARYRNKIALAAGLLLTLGLSFWLGVWHSSRARVPQELGANVHVQEIVPADTETTRDSVPGGILSIPPGMDPLVLLLAVDDFRSFADYGVEVFLGETALYSRARLIRSPGGTFSLQLRRGSLPAGDYRIILYGLAGAKKERLAIYRFRLGYDTAK